MQLRGGMRLLDLDPGTDSGVVVSPDGRLVAVLREERVCLCDAWQSKLVRSLDGAESELEETRPVQPHELQPVNGSG